MNKRIENLMYHAGLTAQGCWDSMDEYDREAIEKFAELIVRECASFVGDLDSTAVKDFFNHFGIEK